MTDIAAANAARILLRAVATASIGTVMRGDGPGPGDPYVSLTNVATAPDGSPVLLLSNLSDHTQNILTDGRASLLFDATQAHDAPNRLAGGRVTLQGSVRKTTDPALRARYLRHHPAAQGYATFGDFNFYHVTVTRAHYIGGFAAAHWLRAEDVVLSGDVTALAEAEDEIIAHMHEDHLDALCLYATVLCGQEDGPWRLSGVDREGMDLIKSGGARARVNFQEPAATPDKVRAEMIRLVKRARQAETGAAAKAPPLVE